MCKKGQIKQILNSAYSNLTLAYSMSRIIPLILLLFYTVSVSGTALHLHFCGSYLESVSFAFPDHDGCCCEKEGKKMLDKNCCENEVIVLKTENEHKQEALTTTSNPYSKCVPVIFPELIFTDNQFKFTHSLPQYHSPPIRTDMCELFVLNCNFRI